jgi:hypothetical protein
MFQPQAMNIINLLTWKVLQIIQRDSLEKLFNTVQSIVVPLPVPQDMNYIPDQELKVELVDPSEIWDLLIRC